MGHLTRYLLKKAFQLFYFFQFGKQRFVRPKPYKGRDIVPFFARKKSDFYLFKQNNQKLHRTCSLPVSFLGKNEFIAGMFDFIKLNFP